MIQGMADANLFTESGSEHLFSLYIFFKYYIVVAASRGVFCTSGYVLGECSDI